MIGAMRIRSVSPACVALLALVPGVLVLSAQEQTLWQLGNFDHTAAEFGGRVGNQPVVVDAGSPAALSTVQLREREPSSIRWSGSNF